MPWIHNLTPETRRGPSAAYEFPINDGQRHVSIGIGGGVAQGFAIEAEERECALTRTHTAPVAA